MDIQIILPKQNKRIVEEIQHKFNETIDTIKLIEEWENDEEFQFLDLTLMNKGTRIDGYTT